MIKPDKKSFRDLARNVNNLKRGWSTDTRKALRRFGERIMTDSKDNYSPVDTGVMRATGRVEDDPDASVIRVLLIYGGGAADAYTIDQHENMSYHHPIGTDHFLLKPFQAALPQLLPTIAREAPIDKVRL